MAIILLVRGYAAAQVTVRETIRFKDTVEVPKYQPEDRGFSLLKLKMQPGEYHIQNIKDLAQLNGQTITGVDLVYSDYPEGEDFSELNRLRILELHMFLPDAFNSPIIEWRIVKQTGVTQTGGLQNYFHGFVVYYRPLPSFEEEASKIKDVIEGKTPPSDSTLLKVFNRNANWKDMLVVCDVTGSMSPYTAQLLFWIKSNQRLNTFKQIVFFNDDDEKSTDQVSKEDASGLWTIESGNSEKVIKTAFDAMQKGGHYENDLEAICYAIKKYPENKKNVVLIADNWETPCDMRLVEFLKKQNIPVRIVVCGVTDRLNTAYLDLAYATGGSIHTMEQDLTDIAKIGEGKTFKLGGMRFRMSGGRFVQL
jgi:hypothetical protein